MMSEEQEKEIDKLMSQGEHDQAENLIKAREILANTNNKITLRVLDSETQQYISGGIPKTSCVLQKKEFNK